MDEYRGFIDKFVSRCIEDLNLGEDYIHNTVEAMNTFNNLKIVEMPKWWNSQKLFKDIMKRIDEEKEAIKKQQWLCEFDLEEKANFIARWKQSCAHPVSVYFEDVSNVHKCS